MEKQNHVLRFVKNAVLIIFGAILLVVTALSMINTCDIDRSRPVRFLWDNPLIHIAAFLLICIVIAVFMQKRKSADAAKGTPVSKRRLAAVFVVFSIVLLLWVIATQEMPRADMKISLYIANQILKGDYSAFTPGMDIYTFPYQGYMNAYPFQLGFVLFCSLFSTVFGSNNYLFFQVLNIAAVVIAIYGLYSISCSTEDTLTTRNLTITLLVAFIPLSLYVTMVYGNLISLCLAIAACCYQLKYFEKRKNGSIIASIICIAFSIILKSNQLIILIALVVMLILDSIMQKKLESLIFAVVMVFFYIALNQLMIKLFEAVTGVAISKGIPMASYIAMGLQNTGRTPGWYNAYNIENYFENNFNTAAASQAAIQDMQSSISKFISDIPYCIRFFGKKIASQWTEPSFQGFWMYESNTALEELSPIIKSATDGTIADVLHNTFLNAFQSFVYIGACCYVFFFRKKITNYDLLFPICFIGGFLFSVIWEAQAQYVMPYFLLLIPLCAKGVSAFSAHIADMIAKCMKKNGCMRTE